jgi:hypothetical protein
MFKKTYSQKIARVFEITNYFMVTAMVVLTGTAILTGIIIFFIPTFIVILIFCVAGSVLGIKYIKHSRGELDEEKVLGMWVGTIFLNALPLLISIYVFYKELSSINESNYRQDFGIFTLIWIILMIWWSLAVVISITAIWSDESK